MNLRMLSCVLLLTLSTGASAQTGYQKVRDPAEPRVQWDYNVFGPAPEGPFRVEVYYKVFNDGLTYRKDNGSYVAEYEIEAVVYEDGDQVTGTSFREKYPVESFPRTLSITDFLVNQLNLSLDHPGRFELVLRLRDVRTEHAAESRYKFQISGKPELWALSRIEFARLIERAVDTSQFNKQGWVVVPSVSRAYGGRAQLESPIYLEVYGPAGSEGVPLRITLSGHDPLDNRLLDTTLEVTSQGRVTPVVATLRVGALSPGRYTMNIRLKPADKETVLWEDTDWFEIIWSLATLLRTDFAVAVEQLRFIASEKERDSLLSAPDSLREEVWNAFWDKRDPTPGTPLNEYRDEYYRRIRYCNSAFSVGKRPGWRTDRGMIYIQYGEPDEVERHPFDMDGFPYNAPWQVWRYYSSNLEFVFVDRRGSGDFELQYPYDGEYWRRN